MDGALEIAKIVIPAAATLVGFYFANAFRRRTKQQVLERRVDAYIAFWPVTRPAASTRLLGAWAGGPMTAAERARVYEAATDWYYGVGPDGKGNGIFLSEPARRVYLKAKENLICPVAEIEPAAAREHVEAADDAEAARGDMSIRQLSLVRWVMRFDLDVHSDPYVGEFDARERAFLEACDIDLTKRPWRDKARAA